MRLTLSTAAALAALTLNAQAADLDRELGLIVSGVVEKWTGVQFIDSDAQNLDDTVLASGGEGRLSLPLGANLSIQNDFKYELNEFATDRNARNSVAGPAYSYQAAAHLSWRNPTSFLFGAFGGAGSSAGNQFFDRQDYAFVGGEMQVYLNEITLYGQGGWVTADKAFDTVDDGLFARGVARWFPTADSRLQIEATYVTYDYVFSNLDGDAEILSGKVRYDFTLAGMPVVGDVPVYLAYRGTHRDNCYFGSDITDHTVMIGTSYSFSGNLLDVDRRGATLDTPDLGQAMFCDFD
jgi:hypothetical protein